MSLSVDCENLLGYSDAERVKWKAWIAEDPTRLRIPFQVGGRFPLLWNILEHVFLVERRHLARLEGSEPPDRTGVGDGDWEELFEYADLVRADFRRWVADLDEEACAKQLTITVASGTSVMSCRKLALHMLLHEVRHFAQMAYAARVAGVAPPGQHDYFYFSETS